MKKRGTKRSFISLFCSQRRSVSYFRSKKKSASNSRARPTPPSPPARKRVGPRAHARARGEEVMASSGSFFAPPAAKSHVEGRLAKLEAKLAETQAELHALKSIDQANTFGTAKVTPAAAAGNHHSESGDDEDVVAMAVHLSLDVSSVKEMSAQQRWLVSSINYTVVFVPVMRERVFFFLRPHLCPPVSDKTHVTPLSPFSSPHTMHATILLPPTFSPPPPLNLPPSRCPFCVAG